MRRTAALGSMSLAAAGSAGKYDVFYSCGNVVSFAADRAIQRRSQGQGHIGTLFHRIFTGALESRHYSTTDFLRELEFLAGSETRETIERMIAFGLGAEPAQSIAALLGRSGLAAEVSESGRLRRRRE